MRLGVVAGGILRPDALTLALSHRERETLPYAGLRQPRLIQDPMPRSIGPLYHRERETLPHEGLRQPRLIQEPIPRSIGPLSRKREKVRVRGKNALPP